MKSLKQNIREQFGNEAVVNRFYNIIQEDATIKGVKLWLQQKLVPTELGEWIRKNLDSEK